MSHIAAALTIAASFTWLGMVLGVSCLEAPLKFRALRAAGEAPADVTRLGVSIGRVVFRALNIAEVALAAVIVVVVAVGSPTVFVAVSAAAVVALLVVQLAAVRPVLDRRSARVLAGQNPPRSRAHHLYLGLELLKVAALITLGSAGLRAI